jgi:hypothetical protein
MSFYSNNMHSFSTWSFSGGGDNNPMSEDGPSNSDAPVQANEAQRPARVTNPMWEAWKQVNLANKTTKTKVADEIRILESRFHAWDLTFLLGNEQEYRRTLTYVLDQVSDMKVSRGSPENRPCHGTYSKVHDLTCGHFVFSESPTLCGKNCRDAHINEVEKNSMLHCTLCSRARINWDTGHYNKRWYDLLLPTFMDPEKEEADWEKYADVTRPTQPAYIAANDCIILPEGHSLVEIHVAIIRAWEWKKEDFLIGEIPRVCGQIGYPRHVSTTALKNFDQLLRHHHMLSHADVRKLPPTESLSLHGTLRTTPTRWPS